MAYRIRNTQQRRPWNYANSSSISSTPRFNYISAGITFTCEICTVTRPLDKKFKNNDKNNKKWKKCSDLHPFCYNCIVMYIKVKVEERTSQIKCPGTNCKIILDPLSCRIILPRKVFVKWCEVLCESTIEALTSPGSPRRKSYCPYPDCSELILDECKGSVGGTSRWGKRSGCPNCKRWFCFKCQRPWMCGHRCLREAEEKNEILFFELVKRQNWAKCPTCNHHIERIDGCTLIVCRCKTQFCYICGSKVPRNGSCVCKRAMWHGPCMDDYIQAQVQVRAQTSVREIYFILVVLVCLIIVWVYLFFQKPNAT